MAQVLKEEVRNKILEAAEKVFYKKDYRGAKLTEIAKEADIPVALIYTYFKNKEVLFDAVVSSVYINRTYYCIKQNFLIFKIGINECHRNICFFCNFC